MGSYISSSLRHIWDEVNQYIDPIENEVNQIISPAIFQIENQINHIEEKVYGIINPSKCKIKHPKPNKQQKWNSNVDVFTATKANEIGPDMKKDGGLFTFSLIKKMVNESGNVQSLSGAFNQVPQPLSTEAFNDKIGKHVTLIQHPDCSPNAVTDTTGWIKDPHRISNAILIEGNLKEDTENDMGNDPEEESEDDTKEKIMPKILPDQGFHNDVKVMKYCIENYYGVKKQNITVLRHPTKEKIANTMKAIKGDGGKNSQIMVYFAGHGFADHLGTHTNSFNDPGNMDKATLQEDVNDLSHKFTNVSVVVESCNSGALL